MSAKHQRLVPFVVAHSLIHPRSHHAAGLHLVFFFPGFFFNQSPPTNPMKCMACFQPGTSAILFSYRMWGRGCVIPRKYRIVMCTRTLSLADLE